jgi:NADH:ubiquinone oxidoreductase subunit F (NADH-binding)
MLVELSRARGFLDPADVERVARELRMPAAEAWEAATSHHEFRFFEPANRSPGCSGAACAIQPNWHEPELPAGCLFRCYEPPASGDEVPFPAAMVRRSGPLLAPWPGRWEGLERARSLGPEGILREVELAGLRGRGGAYFPVATKWRGALRHQGPVALVINAEEGEPGVFKDRALLCLRPERVIEGIAIAMEALQPAVTIAFINGRADPAAASFERALAGSPLDGRVLIYRGAGGYVLGEETALLNAIEGRRAVPRPKPPLPVDAGLFGLPTVVNNVETFAAVSVILREEAATFRELGTADAPGTRILSISGRVDRAGVYEVPFGESLAAVVADASGTQLDSAALLCGGPSGGFLPAELADVPVAPGRYHPTGAMLGAGGVVVLDAVRDIRRAVLAMAAFNAEHSCGKCTPCREGMPLLLERLSGQVADEFETLADAIQLGSLCGLGQMATGPVRSVLAFWPEVFE